MASTKDKPAFDKKMIKKLQHQFHQNKAQNGRIKADFRGTSTAQRIPAQDKALGLKTCRKDYIFTNQYLDLRQVS